MKSNQEQKIETAITDLIDSVERFFGITSLRFLDIDGGCDDIGCFAFPNKYETQFGRFENWFQHLLETLDPFYLEAEQKIGAPEKEIDAIIPRGTSTGVRGPTFVTALPTWPFQANMSGFTSAFSSVLGARVQRTAILWKSARAYSCPACSDGKRRSPTRRRRRPKKRSIRQPKQSPPSSRICESRTGKGNAATLSN
jgi:hypothetical protein